jgi:NAD(P)-dependent dehydrogenase (short-subunit alcohol dehydrogenase family)
MQLSGKVAIVTGGSQGIGEAIALAYAREGAKIAILNRTAAKAERVVEAIRSGGGEAAAFACDIGKVADIVRAVAAARDHFGGVNILVNNAGAYLMTALGGTEEAAVDTMLDVNVKGVFFLCQAVLPDFESRGGGKIINIGSIFGNTGFPGSAIYCATKGAVALLTKTLALELRDRNVQVNCIAPGWFETPLNEGYRATNEEFMRRADERFGGKGAWMQPKELAGTAVFLATEAADAITGTTIFVDRGWSAY